jgi:hypothetical protein
VIWGGEALNKYTPVNRYFTNNRMEYIWNKKQYSYDFKIIHPNKPLTNSSLKVDGKSLAKGYSLNDKMKDVIMLILHGSSCINGLLPDSEKFFIGNLLGKPDKIQHFVKQNYIPVSRQVRGATAVKLGSLAEKFVITILKQELPEFKIQQGEKIENTTFDIVVVSPA